MWLVMLALVTVGIIGTGILSQTSRDTSATPPTLTVSMSLQEVAPVLGVTGKSLARDLDLPLDAPKSKPLQSLGITQAQLDSQVAHAAGHHESELKYYIFVAMVLIGLTYLVRLGRPDGSPIGERKTWYPRWPHIAVLLVSVVVCGFVMGKSPNPMEGIVKVFKSMVGLYPSPAGKVWGFVFFAVLAVVGNKLICGWACPFGALQELIYSLPILRSIKRRHLPFVVSNTIRAGLFVVMLLFLFGWIGGRKGFVLYHGMNPFNLFNLEFESIGIGVTVGLAIVLSLGFYRPFCQFVCPFGFVSWLLERVSIFRIKINANKCVDCGACDRACPLAAAKGRTARKRFPADCFSCGRCLNTCPTDAITYGLVGKKPTGDTPSDTDDRPEVEKQ
jgi:ferredoxin